MPVAGPASFASGFGKGLLRMFMGAREQRSAEEKEARERKERLFLTTLPTLMQNVGDVSDLQPYFEQTFPDMFPAAGTSGVRGKGKQPSTWDELAPMLKNVIPVAQAAGPGAGDRSAMAAEQESAIAAGQGVQPGLSPSATASRFEALAPGAPPAAPPRKTFLGVPLMTDEERMGKAIREQTMAGEADVQAKVNVARRLATTLNIPLNEALDRVGLRSRDALGTPPQPGSFGNAVQLKNAERATAGQPPMTAAETQAFMVEWERSQATAARGYGVDREAISMAMTGKPFGDNDQATQAAIMDEEKKLLQGEATARSVGTGQGRFQSPLTAKEAQDVGAPVGATSAQLAGQQIPTAPERERRRSLEVLKTDLTRVQQLLAVLPSEKDAAGVAPGGVLAVRRRLNSPSGVSDDQGNALSYRSAVAQLESVVDSVVNVLARTRGEQRGTQTERDAERAYNAVVKLQAGLTDPFGGDTRESAAARLREALDGLDRVMAALPATPVPRTGTQPADAPAARPAAPASPSGRGAGPRSGQQPTSGAVMRDGKIYINGQLVGEP